MNRPPLQITLAQINPVVGDITGNRDKILDLWLEHKNVTDLIIFSELVLSGYQPEDLVLYDAFMDSLRHAANYIADKTQDGPALIISSPWINDDNKRVNAALFIHEGQIQGIIPKHALPNYSVFDEKRVFERGALPLPVLYKGYNLGIATCEDYWFADVPAHLKENGADILIALNGSPFELGKDEKRKTIMADRVKETNLPAIYVNQIGGQDEVVYDGGSFALQRTGKLALQMSYFTTSTAQITFDGQLIETHTDNAKPLDDNAAIYNALVLGLKDYVTKNGFPGVLIGLSGGIDSALSAVIAVDALGADKVHCVMMPSPYTSQASLDDAAELAENLGCRYAISPIEPLMKAYDTILDNPNGVTAENIQSRARAMILMALSNTYNQMVLSTGNKSEMAVGYATLYGDMCGGFNVLKDVYKTRVYALSKWRNEQEFIMPERIITRPASAELRPHQKDEDSLPPYEVLDRILYGLIEDHLSPLELINKGEDSVLVKKTATLLDRAEYKRRQAPPGVKISCNAFGRERRMPITNHFGYGQCV